MITALKRLFEAPADDPTEHDLRLAGAVLLLEVAYADFHLGKAERAAFQDRLAERFALAGKELHELVEQAIKQRDLSVSVHEQVQLINDRYDARAKRELVRDLWAVAYADGELHHHEEAVVRRLADLLYVPHRDFIKTKHEAGGIQ